MYLFEKLEHKKEEQDQTYKKAFHKYKTGHYMHNAKYSVILALYLTL